MFFKDKFEAHHARVHGRDVCKLAASLELLADFKSTKSEPDISLLKNTFITSLTIEQLQQQYQQLKTVMHNVITFLEASKVPVTQSICFKAPKNTKKLQTLQSPRF